MKKTLSKDASARRAFGGFGVLLQVGLWLADLAEPGLLALNEVYLAFSLLFAASGIFAFLSPLQPILFFLMSPIQTANSLNSIFGLSFAAVAAILVFRRGWFFRRAMIKATLVSALGSAFLVLPVALSPTTGLALASTLISAILFSALVFGLASRRVLSGLAPKKPVLRLCAHHLSLREMQVVKKCIVCKSVKEIAAELCVAKSTVRNTLSRACLKLGVPGSDYLKILGEQFRIE